MKSEEHHDEDDSAAYDRPFLLVGSTYKMRTPVGTAYITINHKGNGRPMEVFVNVGKAGSDIQAVAEALGRTISIALRFRGNLSRVDKAKEIADQLSGIGGRRSVGFGPNKILSLPDAVAAALSLHLKLFEEKEKNDTGDVSHGAYSSGHTNGTGTAHLGAQLDLAEAVLSAQDPARQEFPDSSGNKDHTTAFAKSNLASNHIAGDICPDCGSAAFVFQEGCGKCQVCGYSEC